VVAGPWLLLAGDTPILASVGNCRWGVTGDPDGDACGAVRSKFFMPIILS